MQGKVHTTPDTPTVMHFGMVGKSLLNLSKFMAAIGGVIFVAMVVMSVISIVGRKLFASPVMGDVEIMQMSSAIAAASFFAYCHLIGEDLRVDFFSRNFKRKTTRKMDAIGSLSIGLFGALIAWRSAVAAISTKESGEITMILEWPLWIAQALMLPGFILLSMAGFYMATIYWDLRRISSECTK